MYSDWKWIYIFHMPLFIFISGYFSGKKDKARFIRSIWKLIEPLIIIQSSIIIYNYIWEGNFSLGSLFKPWWVLWYLLSLIFWRTLLHVIPYRFLKNKRLVLFSTLTISIIAGFLPFNETLSLQRTFSFLPFFFLGYYLKDRNIYLPNKYKPLCLLFFVAMIGAPMIIPFSLNDLIHANPYDSIYGALKRIIVFGFSVPMLLAFINLSPNTMWTARQGSLSMQYYIYHALLIYPLMMIARVLNLPMSTITAIILTIVIVLGIGVASYLPFFKNLTNPSSFWRNN